ncbi:MAG: glycerophosphodiester phosphodiesterase family protein [Nannocystaceae bacterium]
MARSLIRGGTAPTWLVSRAVAHRGLHDGSRPENSLAAFDAAARAGYSIELDVHRTKDGGVVVFHDDTLDRMTATRGKVIEATVDELTALQLGHSDQVIPTLEQVLELVDDRVPVVVEIKATEPIGELEQAVLDVLSRYPGRHAVQSFHPWSLLWMRRHAPDLPRGMLAGDTSELDLRLHEKVLLRHLALAPFVRPHYVGYEIGSLPHWAPSMLRKRGIPLLAWTITDESQLAHARGLADNVIFENVRP